MKQWLSLLLIFLLMQTASVPAYAQLISHTYQFFNTLTLSAPACGGDSLLPVHAFGNCPASTTAGYFTDETIPACGTVRPVYHTNLNWGLRYSNALGTIQNTYTIHLYLKNTDWGTHTWVRIIDFSNGASDNGIYFQVSGGGHCLDFYPSGIVGPCPYFDNTTYYLLTITRDGATGKMDVYINNTLFTSYLDASNRYVGTAGVPINIYRDDGVVTCESGEANFAYLSFTNQYSNQAVVDSVYNHICTIANTASNDFLINPSTLCSTSQAATITYTGNITPPGNGYTFNWNWDGGTVLSGSGMGPYSIQWNTTGTKNVSLTITGLACGESIVQVKPVSIHSVAPTVIDTSICEGGTYLGHTTTGTYADTFHLASGCDSIRILNLTVRTVARTTINQAICQGGNYFGHNSSGTYIDTFSRQNNCDSIRTLHLTVNPFVSTLIDHIICENETYLGYTTSGSFADTFTSSNGCDSIRILRLHVTPKPRPDLGGDRDLCNGDSLILSPGVFASYLWQDNSTLDHFVVRQPGTYFVQVTDTCGAASRSILVRVHSCDLVFPSAFTPNGDGLNDRFGPSYTNNLKNFRLRVYNRWGGIAFESSNASSYWDGTINGLAQSTGVYAWICSFERNGKQQVLSGTVTLIR